jgi:flagellar biogenesis protein FliO
MFLSLALVLAVMMAVLFLVKRFMGIRVPAGRPTVTIEVLAQATLQPKRSIYVIKIGATVFVAGSSEQGLTMFMELNDEEVQRAIDLRDAEGEKGMKVVLNAQNLISRLKSSGFGMPKSDARPQ